MEYNYDLFISHSSKDKQIARLLAVELKHAGFKIWFDEWILDIGDDIYLEIERGLENSRCMIILMSQNFFNSDWALYERATLGFRDPSNKKRTILPVLVERVDDGAIPEGLKKINYFDLTEQNTGRITGIIKILGKKLEKNANRQLHDIKVKSEAAKDNLPLSQGRRGAVYQDIVAFGLGNKQVALLFFDIDGFSYINAKHGVAIGEKIITKVEDLLNRNAPSGSYVARWNADEFVCVIPECSEHEGLKSAKNIISFMSQTDWEAIAAGLFVTVSCGISCFKSRGSMKEVEWVESAILGARSVKVKGGGEARIGPRPKSSPQEVARKVRAPLDYLDIYGS